MEDLATDQRRMRIAFTANVAMFLAGLIGWHFSHHTTRPFNSASDMESIKKAPNVQSAKVLFNGNNLS